MKKEIMVEPGTLSLQEATVDLQWGVRVPLRDGICLNATVYSPKYRQAKMPSVVTLTPYVGQDWHQFAMHFAAHGYTFLTVDSRGRGNSSGEFRPFVQEAEDGYDLVEWIARQPYCNGQVAMWGGSYGGYVQWATVSRSPPHLATIVPVASVYPGVDFPMRNNVAAPYIMQWLTFVSGQTSQEKIFLDQRFWNSHFKELFEAGVAFKGLDSSVGNPSKIFQEWLLHPQRDAYWDSYCPTPAQLAKLSLPILTITGAYDGDQPGALTHYREHVENAPEEGRRNHYLVIGPWDHSGTRTPTTEFGGIRVGPESVVDLPKLHLDWYAWTMQGGSKPAFLQKNVAYYVVVSELWRYADTLEAVTTRTESLFLSSAGNPTDAYRSGRLSGELPADGEPARYVYDPRQRDNAELESTIDPGSWRDQRMLHASSGRLLVYHSAPLDTEVEVSGFFRFTAWVSIDQPDTDLHIAVFDIDLDGSSTLMSADWKRARYRENIRQEKLIGSNAPLLYDFNGFTFASRLVQKGHRLRLVVGPINSLHSQKNYNSGGVISEETLQDARPVTVLLHHDHANPSILHVPIGAPDDSQPPRDDARFRAFRAETIEGATRAG